MRSLIADDVAAQVVDSLDTVLLAGRGDGPAAPLRPSDIAVLVHTNAQGTLIRDALRRAGVEAVLTSANSVFEAPAAGHWLALLTALNAPARQSLVRAAALTPFFGWTAQELGTADEARLDELTTTLRRWAEVAETRGMAALMAAATGGDLAARVLGVSDGERLLTDLRHVGESLHTLARERHLGLTGLIGWLRHRIDTAAKDSAGERSRRLASDLAAVQIVTVHRSKGLEFAADRFLAGTPFPVIMHDADQRIVDIGTTASEGRGARLRRHRSETAGEDLRLFYVAVTRASSRVVLWWAPTRNTPGSPLHRVLFGAPDLAGMLPETVAVPSDDDLAARLRRLPATVGGSLVRPGPVPARAPEPRSVAELRARIFGRDLDRGWRRTSYTGLTAAVHESGWQATSEPEEPGISDEPSDEPGGFAVVEAGHGQVSVGARRSEPNPDPTETVDPEREQRQRARLLDSPMAGLPSGADFGTLVHAVLEKVDHHDASPQALLDRCASEISYRGADIDPAELAGALRAALLTPLGHALGGASLCQVPAADRLTELTFELPLAGGDRPGRRAALLADIADLLTGRLPADDPLAGYPDLLRSPVLARQPLRGYLTGSIDAVLRYADSGSPRYLVVDYKTNLLPRHAQLPTAWDYRREALAAAMMRSHYPLQALLYCVALHRYLRWRQPGYHPDSLAGAAYLFVRGMCGPHTPVVDGAPTGVFSWRPDPALVDEVSALLAGQPR
jgi:exodeoxyribonuclease V beta subunit